MFSLSVCPSPFLYFLLCSLLRPHRPSLTPVRYVAPPPAWSTGVRAEVWGWKTVPWRGWYLRRGDTEEDAGTGTGVTAPHSAPWPDTQTQTRVSHSNVASSCKLWCLPNILLASAHVKVYSCKCHNVSPVFNRKYSRKVINQLESSSLYWRSSWIYRWCGWRAVSVCLLIQHLGTERNLNNYHMDFYEGQNFDVSTLIHDKIS